MISFLKNNFIGVIVILLGFSTTLSAFYPGFMSPDSIEQYTQAITLKFNDTQPPIMSLLWAVFNFFWKGTQTMLIFHLLLYWLSFVVLYAAFKPRNYYLSLCFLIIPFTPFVLNFAGVIWKDVSFAVSWVLCLSLMFYFYLNKKRIKRWHMVILVFLLFYGALSRYNSWLTFPFFTAFVIYLFLIINRITVRNRFRLITVLSIIFTTVFFLLNIAINSFVEKRYNQQGIMLDDICAMYRDEHKDYFPGYIRSKKSFYKLLSDTRDVKIATIDRGEKWDNITYKKEEFDELENNWITSIKENPVSYIKFRFDLFFNNFLRIDSVPFYASNFWFVENDYGLRFSGNMFLFRFYSGYIGNSIEVLPFLFKQYFWLFANLALLLILRILRKKFDTVLTVSLVLLLLASLSYICGYIIWQPCADFRFIYFSIFVIVISIGIMINSFNKVKQETIN